MKNIMPIKHGHIDTTVTIITWFIKEGLNTWWEKHVGY